MSQVTPLLMRTIARKPMRPLKRSFSTSIPRLKQRLVILGSGWGGYELLRGVDKKRWSK
jgi:hypothetical protein